MISAKQKNLLWTRKYRDQEKVAIKNKMIAITNDELPASAIDFDEIKYLFIEFFKKDTTNEDFYKFIKKDIDMIHERIDDIMNYLLEIEKNKNIITCDMLDVVLKIYPEAKRIFYSRENFYQLVEENWNDIAKLLELMDRHNIVHSSEMGIYFFDYVQSENKIFESKDCLNFCYQYFTKNIEKCSLNQLYLFGSVLPDELTNQYLELLVDKDVFQHLQFVDDHRQVLKNEMKKINRNEKFQEKFLQYYSKKINLNFIEFFNQTKIAVLIKHISDYQKFYSVEEIDKIFRIIRSDISFIICSDFDLFKSEESSLPFFHIKELLLTNDIDHLWKIDAYYDDLTPVLENILIKRLQNHTNISIIDSIKSPFTKDYISFMKRKQPEVREKLYSIFYQHFVKKFNIENNDYDKYLHQLYLKYVNGNHIYAISKLGSVKEMLVFLKMRYWQFDCNQITEEQIKNVNVKHLFQLNRMIDHFYQEMNSEEKQKYHLLLMKCYFIFGFEKSKVVLKSLDRINELEHLFDTIDIHNIRYDESGDLILNQKFIRMYMNVFKRKEKDSDAYTLFPEIYNNYNCLINHLQEDSRTLPKILRLYKYSRFLDFAFSPNYYRLMSQLIYLPNNSVVNENIKWYEVMKQRYKSNIPKVSGKLNHYDYEMLDLDDPLTLTVGKRTNCCFLLDGASRTSLKHAMISNNGRVFVVFDRGIVIAQSWVWRDGNIICFDNVEAVRNDSELSECYVEAIHKIVAQSKSMERFDERIKMATIGRNNTDLKYDFIEQYPYIASENLLKEFSPVPNSDFVNNKIYSDARVKQYVLYQEDDFHIEDNNHIQNPIYLDERPSISKIDIKSNSDLFDAELLIHSIQYDLDLPQINKEELKRVKQIYHSKDWYILIYQDGSTDSNIYSIDPRAHEEYDKILDTILLEKEDTFVKKR